MPGQRLHEFTVRGRTSFPIDMLRYDSCWPKSEARDSVAITASFQRIKGVKEERQVTLTGLREPTEGRWESFGWKVA